MQQLRKQFKLLSALQAATVIFNLILMITLAVLNEHGFGSPQSQPTPSNNYFSQKYQAQMQFRKRLRFFLVILALIFLICLLLTIYWGFSSQAIQDIPRDSFYSRANYTLISCAIIFLIPTAGYYTSLTIETQPKSASQSIIRIIIMVQSSIALLLATAIWTIILIYKPLKQQETQNIVQVDNHQKKNQSIPKQCIISVPPINKHLIQHPIYCRSSLNVKQSQRYESLLEGSKAIQYKAQMSRVCPSPTKEYISRPIPLFWELSDFISKPQMTRFFERRNQQQKLRKLKLKQQIEKRKQFSKSPSQEIHQKPLESKKNADEQGKNISNVSEPGLQYIQQYNSIPLLQASKQQQEYIYPGVYKRQPNKITNLFNHYGPNGPEKEDNAHQDFSPEKQNQRRRLFNIVQWNLKEKMLSKRLNQPSIYQSHIKDQGIMKQERLRQKNEITN